MCALHGVLAGRPDAESMTGARWRKGLTALQMATAMGLGAVTLAVLWQTRYAMQVEPGFDPKPILVVDLPIQVTETEQARQQARSLAAALSAQSGVAAVAMSMSAVGRQGWTGTQDFKREGGPSVAVQRKFVSSGFFEVYGVKPIAGRLFDPSRDHESNAEALVISSQAARELGFSNPPAAVGQVLSHTQYDGRVAHLRIVGIAPELRHQSLRAEARPVAYSLQSAGVTMSIRTLGSRADAEAAVRALWPRYFPDAALKLTDAHSILEGNYADDARMARLLAWATAVALALAAFGTYVLAAHTVQRRAREIALRKLHGARSRHIALLVGREIGALALAGAILGLPAAALAIHRYLAGYVEHAPMGGWTLLMAAFATLAVALVAAARHASMALRLSPAAVLRAG